MSIKRGEKREKLIKREWIKYLIGRVMKKDKIDEWKKNQRKSEKERWKNEKN